MDRLRIKRHYIYLVLSLILVGLTTWIALQQPWKVCSRKVAILRPDSQTIAGEEISRKNIDSSYSNLTLSTLDQATQAKLSEVYGKVPLSFEVNQGQASSQVKFLSRGSDYSLMLSATETTLILKPEQRDKTLLSIQLVGANPESHVDLINQLPGSSNYFIGTDPQKWHVNVSHYAKVRYKDVYPGIDMIYYGNQRQLEYDLIVSPKTDPETIRLRFNGTDNLEIDKQGDLLLSTKGGQVRQHRPIIYQEVDGNKNIVAGNYIIKGGDEIGFQVASYDATKPLIIDPILSYDTYLRGNRDDEGNDIVVDSAGNVYVTGSTPSINFPILDSLQSANGGNTDAFIAKLNPAGDLIYSTYLGGNDLSSIADIGDFGNAIAVDSSGNVHVTGTTLSTNFPMASPIQATCGGCSAGFSDAFVVKLNTSGNALLYSTYLGGSRNDFSNGIAADAGGNVYLVGTTHSPDFPLANSLQNTLRGDNDIFVTKLNPAGSALLYSTYIGGSGNDIGSSIDIDTIGNAYLIGSTKSADFPLQNPVQAASGGQFDAFVAKLNSLGNTLVYATYLGGSGDDFGSDIAIDSDGNIYITGSTTSSNFPMARPLQAESGGQFDTFVTKLNATGNALVYSTYFGGNSDDFSNAIGVDSSGSVYFSGSTESSNLPTANALQSRYGGNVDAFVTKLNAAGSALVYSTYLGGSKVDSGRGITVNADGSAHITGSIASTTFFSNGSRESKRTIEPLDVVVGKDAFIVKVVDTPAQPDFMLRFNPTTVNVIRGQSVQVKVNIDRTTGFTDTVTITPPDTKGLKIKVMPRSNSTSSSNVNFTFRVKKRAPTGTQQITFSGRDESGRVRTNTLTLVIQ
jgi:hypothetical protein